MTTTDHDPPLRVVTAYFDAIAARDVAAMTACWAPDGVEHIQGFFDGTGPAAMREFFGPLFAAVPDFRLVVQSTTAEADRVAVHWHADGTFDGPTPFQGIAPTGGRIHLEGTDLLRVRDGLIVRNDAYTDGMSFVRELGMLPAAGSAGERLMTKLFNVKTDVVGRVRSRRG